MSGCCMVAVKPIAETPLDSRNALICLGGAEGGRTPDLMTARLGAAILCRIIGCIYAAFLMAYTVVS